MARMEKEMESLQQDFKAVETSYGDDVLQLVIASGYLAKLIANREIEKYLVTHHAEILGEFRSIVAATSPALESRITPHLSAREHGRSR
jgi:hypothetical protein